MKYILFILLIGYSLQSTAQQPDLVFHHLTEKEGMSYNIVNCFLKDRHGMLWIGTYNGLNRYDGTHFFIFRKEKNSNSLPNNTVHRLAEDQQGNIWGATEEGIFCYDQTRNRFKNYLSPGKAGWQVAFNIVCDRSGQIWASNETGLLQLDRVKDSFVLVSNADSATKPMRISINKNGLADGPDGKGLWLACTGGLMYYEKKSRQLISYANNSDSVLFVKKHASALCTTNFGHYWFSDNLKKQLIGFDPLTRRVKYVLKSKELDQLNYIATVFEDNNHLLWISTWGYQLYTVDYLHGNIVTNIKHHKEDRYSIAGDFFWSAMQEMDGSVWLGTVGGISRCNTTHSFYKVHAIADSNQQDADADIQFVCENKQDGSWWISTSGGSLVRYTTERGITTRYNLNNFTPNANHKTPAHVNSLLFDGSNMYLFSNYGAWVKRGAAPFTPLSIPGVPADALLREAVITRDSMLYLSDGKKVWRCAMPQFNATRLPFSKPFTIDGREPYTGALTPGARGKVWMLNGLDWLSYTNNDELVPIQFSNIAKDGGNGYYTSMTSDTRGDLWITKKGDGLFYYNTHNNTYRQVKQYDGLVMDHVMTVTADNTGKIWAAAYNQISVYNPLLNSFYNFTLPLSENNYAYVNVSRTFSNGHVLCSMADKLVEFFPERLKAYGGNTVPLISSVTIAGEEKRIPGVNLVSLSPDQNSLLIKFGLLADQEASPYDMVYIMEGAEKNWTVAGSYFEASYNSLASGHYTFKVKAVAKDKSWQSKETSLSIHIATPFTKSWWFFAMISSVVALTIYGVYRYRIQQQRQLMELEGKAQLLEKEKTVVLYESLKQQLNPHFLFNSLTSLSGLIDTDQKLAGKFLEQMSKTYRYILKSSENETVLLKDEIAFVKLYIQLQQTRFKTGLEVHIDIDEDYLHCKIAPVTLQNMIENAIKHNIIDPDSPLVIRISVADDYLVIENNLQRKNMVETSNRQGLENLRSLYGYLTTRPILIHETTTVYSIQIPLI